MYSYFESSFRKEDDFYSGTYLSMRMEMDKYEYLMLQNSIFKIQCQGPAVVGIKVDIVVIAWFDSGCIHSSHDTEIQKCSIFKMSPLHVQT